MSSSVCHCPKCRFEYRQGVSRCPDCGAKLEAGPAPEAKGTLVSADTELVRLCRVADPTEAEILRAALAEAGIQSLVQEHGPITARLSRVADGATHDYAFVYVTRNRLAEAREVLAAVESSEIEWPEGMEPDEGTKEQD